MHCDVPIDNWSIFEDIVTYRKMVKGDYFLRRGDKSDDVAIVSKGLFRSYIIDVNNNERTISFGAEGNIMANDHYIFEKTRAELSYHALEDSELYIFKYEDIVRQIDEHREINHIFRNMMAKYFMIKTRREIEFIQFNATQRLKNLKFSLNVEPSRLPKSHLASYLGITPQSLSRILSQLKKNNENVF
jgi:CRP-like cAMP-binding protein